MHHYDLNLLRLFIAIYREGSVTRAAEKLGITQAAASQGLSRLRVLLNDPVFTRTPTGMQPTRQAQVLADTVVPAIADMDAAIKNFLVFDHASSQHIFKLHFSDTGEARFIPIFNKALTGKTDGIRFESENYPHHLLEDLLDSGDIDFALGHIPISHRLEKTIIKIDEYVLLFNKNIHSITRPVSFLDLKKLLYTAVTKHTEHLKLFYELGLNHRIQQKTSSALAMIEIIRTSALCAIIPRHIAQGFSVGENLSFAELDFPTRKIEFSLYWSRRFEKLPKNRWAKSFILQTLDQENISKPSIYEQSRP